MTTETQPLLPSNRCSYLPKVAYAGLASIGLTGFVLSCVDLYTTTCTSNPVGLAYRLFASLGCLCAICLSIKEGFRPRQVQPVNSDFTPESAKVTDLANERLVQIDKKLDEVLKLFPQEATELKEILLNTPREDDMAAKIEKKIGELKDKIKTPSKAFIMALLNKVKDSRQNSKSTTPMHSPVKKSPPELDKVLLELENWLDEGPLELDWGSPLPSDSTTAPLLSPTKLQKTD
jgi:hypothetical protein